MSASRRDEIDRMRREMRASYPPATVIDDDPRVSVQGGNIEGHIIGPQGPIAKLEFWLRDGGRLPRVVRALAWIDELGLR